MIGFWRLCGFTHGMSGDKTSGTSGSPIAERFAKPRTFAATFAAFPGSPPGVADWWQAPRDVVLKLGGEALSSGANDTLADLLTNVSRSQLAAFVAEILLTADAEFAREVIEAPVIPVEESPITGTPLVTLLSRAPEAAGAVVAFWSDQRVRPDAAGPRSAQSDSVDHDA
jgi:hypothetical protein